MMRNVQVQPAVRQRMAARARSLPKFSFGWLVVYIIMIALVAVYGAADDLCGMYCVQAVG